MKTVMYYLCPARCIVLGLLLMLQIPGQSPLISQDLPRTQVEMFFKTYTELGSNIALDQLYGTNPWMDKASDAVNNLKIQMEGLSEDFVGKFYGYDLITEKRLTDSFILLSYLVKFDRQPLRFTFQFYKPKDKWRIFSFKYDGDLDDELEEAAKIYFLPSEQE